MVSLLIVSHSARLAAGVKEFADQVAGGKVQIAAAGGTIDGALGTSVVARRKCSNASSARESSDNACPAIVWACPAVLAWRLSLEGVLANIVSTVSAAATACSGILAARAAWASPICAE